VSGESGVSGGGRRGWSRERLSAVLREEPIDLGLACLLIAADFDPDLDEVAVGHWAAVLADLADRVPPAGPAPQRLRAALGGFSGAAADYDDLRSSLLHEVLRRRRGLPILLSVVWLEVARRAGLAAYGVGLPGHFVVGLGEPGRPGHDPELVDPFHGGATVGAAGADPEALRPWHELAILHRILTNVRRWADRLDRVPHHLRAVELALLLPRHPLALRREHGRLLARSGDFLGGAAEMETFADAVEPVDAEAAATARREARLTRARLN
jgi:regulator of sirC expression with transglutaminase-like and TPR domain